MEEEKNPAVDVKREQQIRKEEIPDNVVTWKPKEESISRRKGWSLAVSGTETPEVSVAFGNRRASRTCTGEFSPGWEWLRSERETGTGENKRTIPGDSLCGEGVMGLHLRDLGIRRGYYYPCAYF